MRIQNHHPHLIRAERASSCHITIDGRQYEAFAGETVAAVMLANGRFPSPEKHTDQPGLSGFFCGIGICYGCQVEVNGQLQRACVTVIHPEMEISTRLEPGP